MAARKCALAVALVVLLQGVVLATTASASTSRQTAPSLTLVIGSPGVPYGPIWVALADRLFEKNGVNVTVPTFNGIRTGIAQLVSGQADLFDSSTAVAAQLNAQGKPARAIYASYFVGAYQFSFLGRSGITSLSQLASMGSNCRISEPAPGTGMYAYTQEFMKAYGLHCSIISVLNPPASARAIESGEVDAGAVFPQDAESAVAAGKGVMLVDASKLTPSDARKIVPDAFLGVGIAGLQSDLQAKRDAVVRFLRALREADVIMMNATPQQLAQMSLAVPGKPFGTLAASALASAWAINRPSFPPAGPTAGFISQRAWAAATAGFQNEWHTPAFNASSDSAQYSNAVDMSYYKAAGIAIAAKTRTSVSGPGAPGKVLTASAPAWTVPPAKTLYQWQVCSTRCVDIKGAHSTKLHVPQSVAGKSVRIVITGMSPTGNTARSISRRVAVT